MAPHEIWCNESQERYVLAVGIEDFDRFEAICKRERAQYAVIGEATAEPHLTVADNHFDNNPVDLPLDVLLGKAPKMHRDVTSQQVNGTAIDASAIDVADAAQRLLRLPTIAEKTFLITIGDRSVTSSGNAFDKPPAPTSCINAIGFSSPNCQHLSMTS